MRAKGRRGMQSWIHVTEVEAVLVLVLALVLALAGRVRS
jgi:hypothetical protein